MTQPNLFSLISAPNAPQATQDNPLSFITNPELSSDNSADVIPLQPAVIACLAVDGLNQVIGNTPSNEPANTNQKDTAMTFCTAHKTPRDPQPKMPAAPVAVAEHRIHRAEKPKQIFTDWASL